MEDHLETSHTIQLWSVPPDLNEDIIKEACDRFGPSSRCFVVKKAKNFKGKGNAQKFNVGYVEFLDPEDSQKLLEAENGKLTLNQDGEEICIDLKRVQDKKNTKDTEVTSFKSSGNQFEQKRFDRQEAHKKKARLIVRNLSFKVRHYYINNFIFNYIANF